MGEVRNPDLDMTLQKGFILVHLEVDHRSVICNWCARELYYAMGNLWARITNDLDDRLVPKCDNCGKPLGEGPAIWGDQSTVQEEPMGEVKVPRGYTGSGLAICHDCLTAKPEYKKVVKDWQVIMPGRQLTEPLDCMLCKKEI